MIVSLFIVILLFGCGCVLAMCIRDSLTLQQNLIFTNGWICGQLMEHRKVLDFYKYLNVINTFLLTIMISIIGIGVSPYITVFFLSTLTVFGTLLLFGICYSLITSVF